MIKRTLAFCCALILLFTLTGCMQYKIAINMEDNIVNRLKFQIAYNEALMDLLGEEVYELQDGIEQLFKTAESMGEDGSENNLTITPLTFEDNGYVFKGTTYDYSFKGQSGFSEVNEFLKIVPLRNNTYRLEVKFDSNDEISEITGISVEEMEEYADIYHSLGFKAELSIITDNHIISHNADKVIGTEYIWDLASRIIENKNKPETLFIEFKVSEDAYVKNPLKEEFIKKYELDPNDPDFYGKALQKVNVLYGTDKGLELDSELLRLQGALIYARLLGLEDEIEAFAKANPDYECGFTDVPEWAKPTMNYLVYNKLVYGKGNNLYGSYDPMSEAQFTALVLRALGYSEANKDFVFVEAPQKAYELGFYITDTSGYEIKNSDRLTRRDMCYIAFNSLFVQNREKSGYLIDNLTVMK